MEKKNKKSRLWVNILGIPLLISCIYFGDTSIHLGKDFYLPTFSLFIYIVMFLSMVEWLNLLDIKSYSLRAINLLAIFFIFYCLAFASIDFHSPYWLGLLFVIIVHGLIISIFHILVLTKNSLLQISSSIFGVLWIGLFIGSMIVVRHLEAGFQLTLMMFLSVWICDTFAFIFGSRYGEKKIIPRVSPNKTWLGSICGFIGSFIVPLIFHSYYPIEGFLLFDYLLCGFIFGLFGQLGDLFESLLKREVKIKDTSNILHGHGGVLDRFDSLSFASPVLLIFLIIKYYIS